MRPGYFEKEETEGTRGSGMRKKLKEVENNLEGNDGFMDANNKHKDGKFKNLTELRNRCRVAQMSIYEEPLCKAPVGSSSAA